MIINNKNGEFMKKLVAIVGMCGSGKSVASDYLENLGWMVLKILLCLERKII